MPLQGPHPWGNRLLGEVLCESVAELGLGGCRFLPNPSPLLLPNSLPQLPAGLQIICGEPAICSSARSPGGSVGSRGLESPMDGGAWKAAVHGVAEGRT